MLRLVRCYLGVFKKSVSPPRTARAAIAAALGALALLTRTVNAAGQTTQPSRDTARAPWEWAALVSTEYRVLPNLVYHTATHYEDKLDLYLPTNARGPVPTLLYFHRGGWMHLSKASDNVLLLPYIAMGFAVANVEFRPGSVAPAPAAVEDARCALRWLLRNARQYNVDTSRIVVSGASAGGHLALMTGILPVSAGFDRPCADEDAATLAAIQAWRGFTEVHVAAVINWYGMRDVEDLIDGPNTKSYAVAWIGSRPDRGELAKRVSPLSYVRPGLPPILTIHGDADLASPYRDAVKFHDALAQAGVKNELVSIREGGHGNFTRDQTIDAYRRVFAFLTQAGVIAPQ